MKVEALSPLKKDQIDSARVLAELGVGTSSREKLAATIPFTAGDVTAGCENELQTAVLGSREQVDLPRYVEESNYYCNIVKRQRQGELPRKTVDDLQKWLSDNKEGVWENSWARVYWSQLSPLAKEVWQRDMRLDKSLPNSQPRSDADKFKSRSSGGQKQLRLPVSYLLKLALIDCLGKQKKMPSGLLEAGLQYAEHFLCDNTSPETFSFYLTPVEPSSGGGRALARETGQRFLLTQLLALHAEASMGLAQSGQRLLVYFSPHPPLRQKRLNRLLSDAFYRELFMNPCLAGWDRGQDKQKYMHLCHQVLSRAQFNGLARLKEAGLINNDLVVLPSASNISLANNGTHVSLGSRLLSGAREASGRHFSEAHEKHLGDLAIKIVEHFLPLFVGSYSADPHRLAFADFHPENVLSFLPYELDYTHLRMIWRRWKKKARLKVKPLGLRLTPFGPQWLDRPLSRLLGLKGDFIPDHRLIDYLCVVMSTEQSPALDGQVGNHHRLKSDLAQLGVFDPRMPLYLLYRQREYRVHGFSGFEGRHYSLFPSLFEDMAQAVDLQQLITALAFKLMAQGRLSHKHIPDSVDVESERRQIFFGAAIGLPTFYVKHDSKNLFLRQLVSGTKGVRHSRRYPGYLRVPHQQFRLAAAKFIWREGRELIENLRLEETAGELLARLQHPRQHSAIARLSRDILSLANADDPFDLEAAEFNLAAEKYYRGALLEANIAEAWRELQRDFRSRRFLKALDESGLAAQIKRELGVESIPDLLERTGAGLRQAGLKGPEIMALINLLLLAISLSSRQAAGSINQIMQEDNGYDAQSSIYQAG